MTKVGSPFSNFQSLFKAKAAALFCLQNHPKPLCTWLLGPLEALDLLNFQPCCCHGALGSVLGGLEPSSLSFAEFHALPFRNLWLNMLGLQALASTVKVGAQKWPRGRLHTKPASDQQCYFNYCKSLMAAKYSLSIINWEPCRPVALFHMEVCEL